VPLAMHRNTWKNWSPQYWSPWKNWSPHRLLKQGCSADKKVWERIQKFAILKQVPAHFKAKHEKGVATPFPRVPVQLHP